MNELLRRANAAPVTFLCALAYVTVAVLTFADTEPAIKLQNAGLMTPALVASGESWRLLTHAFLHGGIVHLLFNLSALMWIGPMLEHSLGSVRFAVLYAVTAVGAGVAVCLWADPRQAVVGGSGALFGMMGAAVAMNMRGGRDLLSFLDFQGPRQLLSLIAVNLVIGWLLPMVSNTAHIGGLLTGFLLTFFGFDPGRGPATAFTRALRAGVAALFVSLCCWCLWPVTRWDWLLRAATTTAEPARQQLLFEAAQRSGLPAPGRPDPDQGTEPDPPPPRRGR